MMRNEAYGFHVLVCKVANKRDRVKVFCEGDVGMDRQRSLKTCSRYMK